MENKKIALFGGTFDPVHLGHTIVVSHALKHIGAAKAIFIPAKCSPLKPNKPIASDGERLEMIKLAIADLPNFEASDYELRKEGPSYTIETVKYFKEQYGSGISVYWLMGTDVIEELSRWYKAAELIDICNLAVMYRAGFPVPDFSGLAGTFGENRIKKLQANVIPTPLVDISSTEIRRRLSEDLYVGNMLPPAVAGYINRHGLYK